MSKPQLNKQHLKDVTNTWREFRRKFNVPRESDLRKLGISQADARDMECLLMRFDLISRSIEAKLAEINGGE